MMHPDRRRVPPVLLLLLVAGTAAAPGGSPRRESRQTADLIGAARDASGTPAGSTKQDEIPGIRQYSPLESPVGWLEADQNPDGSWGSAWPLIETGAVIEALSAAAPRSAVLTAGVSWLAGQSAPNHEFLARQILALGGVPGLHGTTSTLAARLIAARNPVEPDPALPNWPEGGWGIAEGYESDCLTTALGLLALDRAGLNGGFEAIGEALAPGATNIHAWQIPANALKARITITVTGSTVRLRMTEGAPPTPAAPYFPLPPGGPYLIVFPDSGLPFTPGSNYVSVESPNPPAAAATYSMTASWESPDFDTRALSEALRYLRQARNGDGGWGLQRGDPSELYTTLHVLLALLRFPAMDLGTETAGAAAHVRALQLGDGSFGYGGPSIPYVTALAALGLLRSDGCPPSQETRDALAALRGMQSMDGSWGQEPYDTALSLLALWEHDNDGDDVRPDGDCSGIAGDLPCQAGQTTGCDDNCVAYFNDTQGPVVFGQSIDLPNPAAITWPTPVDIVFVKGDLAGVGAYAAIAFGAAPWASSLDISGDSPPADGGFWYLVRPAGDCAVASWQTSPGAEPGRDAALRGSIDVVITAPADGAVLTASPAAVSGTVNGTPPISVTVNGVAASVAGGIFSASVPLVRGANTITASGIDGAGQSGSDGISVTLVDHSIARGGLATGSRIFTGDAAVLNQAAYFTESRSGVPAGVTYTTTGVARISATEMQVSFRIDVGAGATPGLYFFQVTYGLLDAGLNPLGPLSGNVFDFEIEVRP